MVQIKMETANTLEHKNFAIRPILPILCGCENQVSSNNAGTKSSEALENYKHFV